MTITEFINKIESYYGNELPGLAKSMTMGYLKEYDEENLNTLLGLLLKSHPIKFGTPAIATIEAAHRAYVLGDEKNKIHGHDSLKARKGRSACSPAEDNFVPLTNEEWEAAGEGLLDLKKAVRRA